MVWCGERSVEIGSCSAAAARVNAWHCVIDPGLRGPGVCVIMNAGAGSGCVPAGGVLGKRALWLSAVSVLV